MAAAQIQTRSLFIGEVIRYQLTVGVGLPNPIGVNLGIFANIFRADSCRCRPYGAKELGQTRFYTDAAPTGLRFLKQRFSTENTQANKPYGTKEVLEFSRFPRRIRFGFLTEPHCEQKLWILQTSLESRRDGIFVEKCYSQI